MTRPVFLMMFAALAASVLASSVPEMQSAVHQRRSCPDECTADVAALVQQCGRLDGCSVKLCGDDPTATPALFSCSRTEDGSESTTTTDFTTTTGGSTTTTSTTSSTNQSGRPSSCSYKSRGVGRPVNGFYSITCACKPGKRGDASLRYKLSGPDQSCFFECMKEIPFRDMCLQKKLKLKKLTRLASGCCKTCGGTKRGNKRCAF